MELFAVTISVKALGSLASMPIAASGPDLGASPSVTAASADFIPSGTLPLVAASSPDGLPMKAA